MLESYLKKIIDTASRGDAREESFYSALEKLLEDYKESVNKRKIQITTLPAKTEGGNPDFRIWDGKQQIVGYIEAKAPHVEHLDQIEDTEQLERYIHTFPNVILTNFFEFRLYRHGKRIDSVRVSRSFLAAHKIKAAPPVENEAAFLSLLEKFFSFSLPKVNTAKSLALELAKRTRYLRDVVITEELTSEKSNLSASELAQAGGKNSIHGFYETFKRYLISGLTPEQFSDLYSQTITYGLFAARTRSENGFSRREAFDNIPRTIGILREVFRFISLGDLPPDMEWLIDDISEVLAVTDVHKLLHQFFHEGKGRDPIIHFYETFLAEYDPKTREKRGVYYTPEPVVSYIVHSLNIILKEVFNKPLGFGDESVTVLDPASGTLTFLAEAAKLAVEESVRKYGEGTKEKVIRDHILKNFYAFELMMAPYAVGHLKMSFLLEELGYKLQKSDRVKLYLTNTLEMEELAQADLPFMASLSEESRLAGKVKKEQPILVILGNPPYEGMSVNSGKWITELIETYKYVDGKHFGEKKHWLQNDYVKFIRFAQWKIDEAGEGVVGFITDHSYLESPTFRGMRQSLMNTFNDIYIFDLHGDSKKREKCPDGSKDENVFDITQGVAIALFVKKKGNEKGCKIYFSEIWGLREKKYQELTANNVNKTNWLPLKPVSPFYSFAPREETNRKRYENYPQITEIFTTGSTGVQTSRDDFAIDFTSQGIKQKINLFLSNNLTGDILKQTYNLKDMSFWNVSKVRQQLAKEEDISTYFTKIAYRPFDARFIFYHDLIVHRTKKEVMRHMLQQNLGMCVGRAGQVVGLEKPWNIIFVSESIEDLNLFYRGGNVNFPLYLYTDADKKDLPASRGQAGLFSHAEKTSTKQPNLNHSLVEKLSEAYKGKISPEDIFYYIYAVLYSNIYRKKYAEFLKTDFPRVPFTIDEKLFRKMGEYGKRLVDLHLLKSKELDSPVAKYPVKGSDKVEKLRYENNRVYINAEQYFDGAPQEVYEYQVGGYQVCMKWLKDRKSRKLSLDDIKHYCNIVTALHKTIALQKEIDKIYPDVERGIIERDKLK